MRALVVIVAVTMFAAAPAAAQTFDDVQIQLGLFTVSPEGGERPAGMWASTGPVVIGRSTTWTYSLGKNCDAWTLAARDGLADDATTAWKLEATPGRVANGAVTFRLRWVRASGIKQQLDRLSLTGATAAPPMQDVELTLRPGQSWPIDSMKLPEGKTVHGRPCAETALLRASVAAYPMADDEARLVSTEMWLVERLADGTDVQRSQPLTVRGLPNHPGRFFFDTMADGADSLDLYGMVLPRVDGEGIALTLETRARWKKAPSIMRGPHRTVNSEIRVKPDETVELKLPVLGEMVGPFAKRTFSIRVRSRLLR